MSSWTILIYAAAAVMAVQSLLALMTAHRKRTVQRLMNEELARRDDAMRTPDGKPTSTTQPPPAGRNPRAA
ncbi:MAG: hypothetical protein U0872_10995 [Planctomycetaceae bacterium]